jgi:hypothetical protein
MVQCRAFIRRIPFPCCWFPLAVLGWVLWVNAFPRACPAEMSVPLQDCPITAQASTPAAPFSQVGTYESQAACHVTALQHARQLTRSAMQQRRNAQERFEDGRLVVGPRAAEVIDYRRWCLPEGEQPTLPALD